MKTGYLLKNKKFVYVWIIGYNASKDKALVTEDEEGLSPGGEKYLFVVDVLDLFVSDTD